MANSLPPLDPSWAERLADACPFILVNPTAVVAHCKSLEELVQDYVRLDTPYAAVVAYRKLDYEEFVQTPGVGPWILIRGMRQRSMTADQPESVLKWFPIFNKNSESKGNEKLRLYAVIDVSTEVKAVYTERHSKESSEKKRKAERFRSDLVVRVMRIVDSGADSIEDIAEYSCLSVTEVEIIVQGLIHLGKLKIVDYQPPVQKLIKRV
jgi:predicted HTH domain antitoxin